MPDEHHDLSVWLGHITEDEPPFIRSLCKSLRYESLLVRLPTRAKLCNWGMTAGGRVGVINEDDPEGTLVGMPGQDCMLPPDDAEYAALVRQEDPEANLPWAFAVAAFKYAGGHVPQPPPGADKWEVLHLYEVLTRYADGNQDEAHRTAKHFTQSANLVALHPVVQHLIAQYPCIVLVLQRRAFDTFGYDPANQFAPGREHDNCGFVLNDA